MTDNPIRILEKQSGLLRLLIYLGEHSPVNVQYIVDNTDIYPNIMYSSLDKAKDLNLIQSKLDKSAYPPKNMLSLTLKGKEVSKKLKDIDQIISGKVAVVESNNLTLDLPEGVFEEINKEMKIGKKWKDPESFVEEAVKEKVERLKKGRSYG